MKKTPPLDQLSFYHNFRRAFDELIPEIDEEHIRRWFEVSDEFAFVWFESLAEVVNKRMRNSSSSVGKVKEIFQYMCSRYSEADDRTKNCIDCSFVENLFWRVDSKQAEPYWAVMPTQLRQLYANFHGSMGRADPTVAVKTSKKKTRKKS